MRSDFVVITGISLQNSTQLCLAEDYDMIGAFAPDRSDQPFSKAILPRCACCDGLVTNAHGAQPPRDDIAVDAVPIANQVARSIVPGERRRYLARNPFCRRMCCGIDPDQVSAVQPHDDEGLEQIEANGRHNEEIHRSNVRRVVSQEGAPPLAWRSMPLGHVLGNARLRDLKPKLQQLAMDARRSPQRVLNAHLPDQLPQRRVDLRPPAKRARLPTPVPTKAGPMPTDEGLGTDDRDDLQDRRKPSIQLDKEQAIAVRKPDAPVHHAAQHNQLVSERSIFGFKPALRLEWRDQDGQDKT